MSKTAAETIKAALSKTVFKSFEQLNLVMLPSAAKWGFASLVASGGVRARKQVICDSSGRYRPGFVYALGVPKTEEEIKRMAYCQDLLARKRSSANRSERKRAAITKAAVMAEVAPPMRIDPMIWRTCGRKVPEVRT